MTSSPKTTRTTTRSYLSHSHERTSPHSLSVVRLPLPPHRVLSRRSTEMAPALCILNVDRESLPATAIYLAKGATDAYDAKGVRSVRPPTLPSPPYPLPPPPVRQRKNLVRFQQCSDHPRIVGEFNRSALWSSSSQKFPMNIL